MKNYYEILGISPKATPEEVKKAYFDLAKKYHPDSGDESEVKKFHEIAEAHKNLSNKELRDLHDMELEEAGVKPVRGESAETQTKASTFSSGHRESYRDEELRAYNQNRFVKALFRVFATGLLVAALGIYLATILVGSIIIGLTAGLFIGIYVALRANFNLESYFHSIKNARRANKILGFLAFAGVAYFLWLGLNDFI